MLCAVLALGILAAGDVYGLEAGYVQGDAVSYSYVPNRYWTPEEAVGILPYLCEYELMAWDSRLPLETFHSENVRRIDLASQWSTAIMFYARRADFRDELIRLMLRAYQRRQLFIIRDYWWHGIGFDPIYPANNKRVEARTAEWHSIRTVFYPEGVKTCVCKNANDPATWTSECWSDTHALLNAIRFAQGERAMMIYIGLSSSLEGAYTTPVGTLGYMDKTLVHYTPEHPEGRPYPKETLDRLHDEFVASRMRMFNDMVHDRFAHLNGPARKPDTPTAEITNTLGMKLRYIPAGVFVMGSGDEEKGREEDEARSFCRKLSGRRPNARGLFDMGGNVWEWCSDRHGEYADSAAIDPPGPKDGTQRVIRGGWK